MVKNVGATFLKLDTRVVIEEHMPYPRVSSARENPVVGEIEPRLEHHLVGGVGAVLMSDNRRLGLLVTADAKLPPAKIIAATMNSIVFIPLRPASGRADG